MAGTLTPSWSNGFAHAASESLVPEQWRGLILLAAPTLGQTGLVLYNLAEGGERESSPISSGGWDISVGGIAWAHTVNTHQLVWANPQNWLPTGPITIVLDYEKRDTTWRNSAAFGFSATTNNIRCGAHLPFSDGTVYFDYGGASGSNRLTVAGMTFERAVWAFTNGARGLEIWKNGIRRANSVTEVARVANSVGWNWGRHAGAFSDFANYYQMRIYSRQLSLEELTLIMTDDLEVILRRPRRRVGARPTVAAALNAPRASYYHMMGMR